MRVDAHLQRLGCLLHKLFAPPPLWPGDLRNDGGSVAAALRTAAGPDWMEAFGRTIDGTNEYALSSTLDQMIETRSSYAGIWTRLLAIKRKSGKPLLVRGLKLPPAQQKQAA